MSDLMLTRFAPASQTGLQTGARNGWGQLAAAVMRAYSTRRALPELSDQLLADIGVSRSAALAEAARLPWDTRPVRRWRRATGTWSAMQRRLERIRLRWLLVRAGSRVVPWGG